MSAPDAILTPEQVAALREAAEKATPVDGWDDAFTVGDRWADFQRLSQPPAILALLAERERLEEMATGLNDALVDAQHERVEVTAALRKSEERAERAEAALAFEQQRSAANADNCSRALRSWEAAEAALRKSEERAAELEKALEPFAAFCEQAERFVEDRARNGGPSTLPTSNFRLADFRRARATLTKEPAA